MTISKVSTVAGRWGAVIGIVAAALIMAGCKSGPKFSDLPGTTGAPTSAPMVTVPGHPAAAPALSSTNRPTPAPVLTQVSNPGAKPGDIESDRAIKELNTINVNDVLIINFFDLALPIMPMEQQVKDDGTITLIQNQKFTVAGKTRGELETEIRKRYVPDYFPTMTVNVAKKPDQQFYYVGGDVKLPGRQLYVSRLRVLGAIKSAGDFTDFAKRTGVELTRADGRKFVINAKKAQQDPRLDLEVLPGDNIYVPRRINPFTH